jgi:hypothetical protein
MIGGSVEADGAEVDVLGFAVVLVPAPLAEHAGMTAASDTARIARRRLDPIPGD